MAYKYQQNLLGSASKGYVKYNIIPDFGTILKAGQTVQISGQMYSRDNDVYGIGLEASASSSFTELASIRITAANKKNATFTIEFTATQSFIDQGPNRVSAFPIRFLLYTDENFSSASMTFSVIGQELYLAKYITPPSLSIITISDENGVYEHFNAAVQNKSKLVLDLDCYLDELIPGIFVETVRVEFVGDPGIILPIESIETKDSHVTIKLKPIPRTYSQAYIAVTITDSMGNSSDAITSRTLEVLPYYEPTLSVIQDKPIAQRYNYVYDDYGNQTLAYKSDGPFVALNFKMDVATVHERINTGNMNRGNAWQIETSVNLDGTDEWIDNGVAFAGNWGQTSDIIEDMNILPRDRFSFEPGLKYNIRITLTDFFTSVYLLGEINKFTAHFHVSKYGVAANMRSTASNIEPKNECLYPLFPYQGIVGLTYLKKDYEQKAGVSPDGKQLYTKTLSVDVTAGSAASAPIERLGSVYRLDGVLVSSNQTTWPINFYLNENNHCACYRPGSARSVTVASAGMSGKAFVTVLYAKADTDDPEAVYLWNNAPIPGYDWQSNGYKRPHFTGNAVGVVESDLLRIKLPAVTGSNSIPYSAHLNTTDIVAVPSGLTRFNILAKKTSTTPTYIDFGLIASNAANSYSTENGGQMSGDITLTEVETVYTIDLSGETISNANLKCVINGKANLKNLVPAAGVEVYALWFD